MKEIYYKNPMEDFAESFAFFVYSNYLNGTWIVDTRQGQQFDLIEKLHSNGFSKKYDYISRIISNQNLNYP